MIQHRRLLISLAAIGAAGALTACGSSSSSSTAASGSSGTPAASSGSSTSTDVAYSGSSSSYFTTVPDPTLKAGTHFVLGYADPYAAIPALLAQQKAACAEATTLGGSCIAKDANVNAQTQVTDVNELLTQKVTAIAISPLNPSALAPAFTAAKKANVPIVGTELPSDLSTPLDAQVSSTINQAMDYCAWATMTAVAKKMPGASFGVLGTASPNPVLQYLITQEKKWATTLGLHFLGEVDAQTDTPTQWASAGSTLATKYPAMTLLLSYNDPSALAASGAVRAAGKTNVKVADANGYSSAAKTAIADGQMVASYAVPWNEMGRVMAIAAYDAQTGQTLPKAVAIKGVAVTSANAASVATTG